MKHCVINWMKYGIDHTYCVSVAGSHRIKEMKRQLDHIDIPHNSKSFFSWELDIDDRYLPIDAAYLDNEAKMIDVISRDFLYDARLRRDTYKRALRHYAICKRSLLLGYDRIIEMEDDCRFLKDKRKIIDMLDHLDWDCDLLVLSPSDEFSFPLSHYEDAYYDVFVIDAPYQLKTRNLRRVDLFSSAFLVMSRRAMQAYIDLYENVAVFSPDQFYSLSLVDPNLHVSFAMYPICRQVNDDGTINELGREFTKDQYFDLGEYICPEDRKIRRKLFNF